MSSACPICSLTLPVHELERHANEHFVEEDYAADFELAHQISLIPPDLPLIVEDSYKHQPYYGETPETSYARESHIKSHSEKMHDENNLSLVRGQKMEVFYKVEHSLMPLLRNCLELESDNSISVLSGHVDHLQSTADVKWGCGWRNIQMLSSHLLKQRPEARAVLFGGSGFIPNVASLQRWLELAWEKGFDTPGALEFDQKICGKNKWIGTTECAALLRSFGLRARIVDFCSKYDLGTDTTEVNKRKINEVCGPMDKFLSKGKVDSSMTSAPRNKNFKYSSLTSEKGHQALTEWVWNYFSENNVHESVNRRIVLSEKAPLYFQHAGHSRTIVGIQSTRQKNGMQKYTLLIFDPAERTRNLEKALLEKVGWQKRIKRGAHTLKKPQYQLCFVDPGIAHGEELEQLKALHSIRQEF